MICLERTCRQGIHYCDKDQRRCGTGRFVVCMMIEIWEIFTGRVPVKMKDKAIPGAVNHACLPDRQAPTKAKR